MKNNSTLILLFILFYLPSRVSAQFVVGESGFFVRSGTIVSIDSLVLTPAPGDLYITDDRLTVSYDAVGGNPSSIERVYRFDTGFDFAGTVGLFYRLDEVGSNVESDLQIAYSADGAAFEETSGSAVNTTDKHISNTVSDVFLKSVTAVTSGALPVTLIDFNVKKEGESAVLSWMTTYEKNSASFEIQRSIDGKNWRSVKRVDAAGNSLTNRTYSFTDFDSILPGIRYYRLKMNDIDGTYTYSEVKSLDFKFDSSHLDIVIHPNPSVDNILLKWTGAGYLAKTDLLNMAGSKVVSFAGHGPDEGIDVSNLPSGMYILRVTDTEGGIYQSRFVKP